MNASAPEPSHADGTPFVLRQVRVPTTFLGDSHRTIETEAPRCDIGIADGIIRFVAPAQACTASDWADVRIDRAMAWPALVEPHTHLDSGHIWPRSPNPDGSFASAAAMMIEDRETHWSPDDMRRRMEFGLRSAFAHGVRAMRTHLASQNDRIEERWEIFADLRAAWAGRIDLQAVPLLALGVLDDPAMLRRVVGVVLRHGGGVLGGFAPVTPDIDRQLADLFDLAARHGLSLDFHADETTDPASDVLRRIASIARDRGSAVPVMVGHCCSLAEQDEDVAAQTLDLVAETRIAIVTLPSCNLYLQDRRPGRTPRRRGVTLLHEMAARGIPVSIGTDNVRDPFHAYGDFDPVESFRDAARIVHLDHPIGDWPRAVTTTPGAVIGQAQAIRAGDPADLVLFRAASFNELLARPAAARTLIRAGRFVTADLPDYSELDA
jgi:cytosine deaminase